MHRTYVVKDENIKHVKDKGNVNYSRESKCCHILNENNLEHSSLHWPNAMTSTIESLQNNKVCQRSY